MIHARFLRPLVKARAFGMTPSTQIAAPLDLARLQAIQRSARVLAIRRRKNTAVNALAHSFQDRALVFQVFAVRQAAV